MMHLYAQIPPIEWYCELTYENRFLIFIIIYQSLRYNAISFLSFLTWNKIRFCVHFMLLNLKFSMMNGRTSFINKILDVAWSTGV